ncbi:hypothetical protein [Streptomyces shenzhenensis]|uniref:hypothetical protein n=1 Tax=Streptomyces shenzhenensis TaxID=943815 RepID=UPI0033CF16F4
MSGSNSFSDPSVLAITDLSGTGQATYTFYADNAADWRWTADELAGSLTTTPSWLCG